MISVRDGRNERDIRSVAERRTWLTRTKPTRRQKPPTAMSKVTKKHASADLVDHVRHLEAVVEEEEEWEVDDGTEEVVVVVAVGVEVEEYTAWTTYETVVDQAVQ